MRPINVRLPDRQIHWLDSKTSDLQNRSTVIRLVIDEAMRREQERHQA